MDFNSEAEDDVIREAVWHKLDRPLLNPPNKVWRGFKKIKASVSTFQIGDSLRYINKGHN